MVRVRSGLVLLVMMAVALVTGLGSAPSAQAAQGDIGYQDQSFTGVSYPPTSDKPQSKLWYAGGFWFADLFDASSRSWHIYRLNRSTQTWVDTGVANDTRANTLADTLWDGNKLYIASHVVTVSSDAGANASQGNSPARLYRYSYNAGTQSFTLDAGFPSTITTQSSESLTIDKDSTGTLWATWTQVSGSSAAGYTSSVMVNNTTGSDTSWGTPFTPSVGGVNPAPDDISTVVAFGQNKVGLLWSNQLDDTVYWAVHNDGASRDSWRGSTAARGSKLADDHLNIKSIQADPAGRVVAVVKTSLDSANPPQPNGPQISLLIFKPGTGSWTSTPFGTVADCHTRPMVMLDEQNSVAHVFATAPSGAGCDYSGQAGTIYEKTTSLDNPTFPSGRGTPVIRDIASPAMNDVTSTKQSVTNASGLVVLASNMSTQRYWHADLTVGSGTPVTPTASFTTSVTNGVAPLAVAFTDTSAGTPTSWAWDFGDGATATTQSPSHTFTAAGTYTVSLRATNTAGTSAAATQTITVTAAPPSSGGQVTQVGSSQTSSTNAVTSAVLQRPAGVAAGDVLVAQVTADGNPDLSSVPAGWTQTLTGPLSVTGGARVFVYHHVVGALAGEPTSYSFGLSTAVKWGGGITAFRGVDTTTPFDSAQATAQDLSYGSSTVTVPSVTTVTAGAMLVGGVGLDSSSTLVTQPTGWTEDAEATGAQIAELAHKAVPTPGASGPSSWTLSKASAWTGWVRALRPGTATPPPATAPTASFTQSTSSGVAPLAVTFTDTSTGSPTAWAWDFGDGGTATTQSPSHTFAAAGTYTVSLRATNAGGTSTPATKTVTVTATPPPATAPTASFTQSTSSGVAPLAVTFTDTSTGSPTSWAWDFGDGGTATTQSPSHTFAAAGTYTVSLRATNAGGTSTPATKTVTVTAAPPAAPTASFTQSTSSGVAPLAVTFTDTSTGSPTSWAWDFGDGGTATTQSPSHTFAAAGTYTVSLRATNAGGTSAAATKTVTVTAAPPPPPAAPTASFTQSTSSGVAPLAVTFTDTSTGSPTSWAWDFGDGGTATTQSPSHTFAAAGTYTVSLRATNAGGTSAAATKTVTVTAAPPPPPPSGGAVTAVGASNASSTAAVTAVTVPRPSGVAAGDVLVAQITSDGQPAMGTVPTGWTSVLVNPLDAAGGARIFAYYHVVGALTGEPTSYTWQLGSANKWGAGMTAFRGVNTSNPFDTAVSTATDTSYNSSTVSVPSVTTATAGAMLVGGVGLDSSATAVGESTGWTEDFEASGAQVAEMAHRSAPTAGASGTVTWSMSKSTAWVGWLRALRPAA